jgi:hypothetical protein
MLGHRLRPLVAGEIIEHGFVGQIVVMAEADQGQLGTGAGALGGETFGNNLPRGIGLVLVPGGELLALARQADPDRIAR